MSWKEKVLGGGARQRRLRSRAIGAAFARRALRVIAFVAALAVEGIVLFLWNGGLLVVALGGLVSLGAPFSPSLTAEGAGWAWAISASCWLGVGLWGAWDWRRWSKAPAPQWTVGWQGACARAMSECLKPGKALVLRVDFWFYGGDLWDQSDEEAAGSRFRRIPESLGRLSRAPRSALECLEPLILARRMARVALGQFVLAAGSVALALVGWCAALALAPLALVERCVWRLSLDVKGSGAPKGGVSKFKAGAWILGSLAFPMAMGLAALSLAPAAMIHLLMGWRGQALLSPEGTAMSVMMATFLGAGALVWCRTAPGAFGAGWVKRPVFAVVWALLSMASSKMDEVPLFELLEEGWELKEGRGRGWRAAAWAAAQTPMACWQAALIGGGLLLTLALAPLLALEFLMLGVIDSIKGVASGKAGAAIKAGLSILENEGAADFSKAEREALLSVAKGQGSEGKRKGPSRL